MSGNIVVIDYPTDFTLEKVKYAVEKTGDPTLVFFKDDNDTQTIYKRCIKPLASKNIIWTNDFISKIENIIEYLIKNGENVDRTDNNMDTPLILVTYYDSSYSDGIFDLLIRNGANVNAVNKYNTTAIQCAAMNRNYDRVKTLLLAGANINLGTQNKECYTVEYYMKQDSQLKNIIEKILKEISEKNKQKEENTIILWKTDPKKFLQLYSLEITI